MYVVYNPHVSAPLHFRADRFATHRTRIAAAVGIYLFVAALPVLRTAIVALVSVGGFFAAEHLRTVLAGDAASRGVGINIWRQQAAVIATVLRRPMAGQIAFACKLFVAPVAGMPRL